MGNNKVCVWKLLGYLGQVDCLEDNYSTCTDAIQGFHRGSPLDTFDDEPNWKYCPYCGKQIEEDNSEEKP